MPMLWQTILQETSVLIATSPLHRTLVRDLQLMIRDVNSTFERFWQRPKNSSRLDGKLYTERAQSCNKGH